jgi:hypothetical protein
MNEPTHTGKIACLPRTIRDQLNQRLDNGEPSGPVLTWLNALPEAQAVLAARFGNAPINAQNLTNWRQGGFQDWRKQQERLGFARELTQDAGELAADTEGAELANHLSTLLVAELAAAARSAQAELTDPAEQCQHLQELLHTLARVRRQDCLAGRLALDRERRERERAKEQEEDERREDRQRELEPLGLAFNRSRLAELFAQPDFTSQALADAQAESLLRKAKPERSAALNRDAATRSHSR